MSSHISAPGRRLRLVGPIPDAALGWAACLGLVAVVLAAPPASIVGIPAPVAWFGIVVAVGLGLAVAGHSRTIRAIVVFAAALIAAGLVVLALPYVLANLLPIARLRVQPLAIERLSIASALIGLASVVIGRRRGVGVRPATLLVVGVVTTFLFRDRGVLASQLMRDLNLDLIAGGNFVHGQHPYLAATVTSWPSDLTQLPFLYPPFALPLFGFLSLLPAGLVMAGWLALSVAGSVAALRWLGVRWAWVPVLLLWPPFFEGLAVGNVAVLAFVPFVAAPRASWTLPLMGVFKLQSLIPSLWLVRERRWRSLAVGLAVLGGIAIATLPIVGIGAWSDWLRGLLLFEQSQVQVRQLYGLALPHYVPYGAFLIVSVLAVTIATVFGRGLAGLARLGVASVVASPSLFSHGLLVTLPGLLGNRELLLWLALGLSTYVYAHGWWLTIVLAVVGTLYFASPGTRAPGTVHPLGSSGTPWSPDPGRPDGMNEERLESSGPPAGNTHDPPGETDR